MWNEQELVDYIVEDVLVLDARWAGARPGLWAAVVEVIVEELVEDVDVDVVVEDVDVDVVVEDVGENFLWRSLSRSPLGTLGRCSSAERYFASLHNQDRVSINTSSSFEE